MSRYVIKKKRDGYYLCYEGTVIAPNGAKDVYSDVVAVHKTLRGSENYAKRLGFRISEKPTEAKKNKKKSTKRK